MATKNQLNPSQTPTAVDCETIIGFFDEAEVAPGTNIDSVLLWRIKGLWTKLKCPCWKNFT